MPQKQKNKFLLAFLFAMVISVAWSQDETLLYTVPSPNAQSLAKFAAVPVSLYTGTAAVQIPLLTLPGKYLNMDVGLKYHASGVKVQDVSSWVGLGWGLDAGGVVTRTVRGLPDEKPNGYCGSNGIGYQATQPLNQYYVGQVSAQTYDGEPDLFYFNFMGHSGKFVLDIYGVAVGLPQNNLKILSPFGAGNGKWIITTPDGIKYTFGADANAQESTTSKISGSSTTTNYVSSWYLSEVKSPEGELLSFTYQTGPAISYNYYSQSNTKVICNTGAGTTTDRNIEITIDYPRYLQEVTSKQGKLVFSKAYDTREDITNAYSLRQIALYDRSNTLVNSVRLTHSYFQSDGCATALCKRLKLTKVTQAVNGVQNTLYSFNYNSTNLPSRDSHQIDHWGYYNSNAYGSKIPQVTEQSSSCPSNNVHEGADKSPDSLRSRANILTHVYNSSGGYMEFIYGAHKYWDGSEKIAGGARIISQKTCASGVSCTTVNYTYRDPDNSNRSSGTSTGTPIYQIVSSSNILRESQSLTSLFDLDGCHVGYSTVYTRAPGMGWEIQRFTSFADQPDTNPEVFMFNFGMVGQSMAWNSRPFPPKTSKAWERGVLKQKSIYSPTSKLLFDQVFEYRFDLQAVKTLPAYRAVFTSSSIIGGAVYAVGKYYVISRPLVHERTRTTTYDQNTADNDNSKYFKTITTYTYNPTNLLQTKIVTYNDAQSGLMHVTDIKYPIDFPFDPPCEQNFNSCISACNGNSECISYCYDQRTSCLSLAENPGSEVKALRKMQENYQISEPVEIKTGWNEYGAYKLIDAKIIHFGILGSTSIVKPAGVSTVKSLTNYQDAYVDVANGLFVIDTRMRNIIVYDGYDVNTGNLTSFTPLDGSQKTIGWDWTGSQLIYTVDGFNTNIPKTRYYTFRQAAGGLSAEQNVNSRDTQYIYDALGRPKLVLDGDGKIMSRTKTRQNGEGYVASINVYGLKIKNNNNLIIEDGGGSEQKGTSTYSWNFGDGGTSSSGGAVTHGYSAAGTYTVTLTKTHPEYGTSSASTNVTIVAPSATFCIDGPVTVDLCDGNPVSFGNCTVINTNWASSTTLKASMSNGCGQYTYTWYYSSNNQAFASTSSTEGVTFPYSGMVYTGSIYCIATDECGNSVTSGSFPISFTRSNPCHQQ